MPSSHDEALFEAAWKLTDLDQRKAFLDAACAGEADFFSHRAVELSPNDAEVLRIRDEIKTKTSH